MAVLFHEIRNPMQSVVTLVDFLRHSPLSKEQLAHVNGIDDAIKLMRRLTEDVLDITKVEVGNLSLECIAFDLVKTIRAVTNSFGAIASSKNIAFTVALANDLPNSIVLDPTRLQQVISNLLSNAFKFTNTGAVSLTVKRLDNNSNGCRRTNFIELKVQDSGIGMPAEEIAKLFIPFGQTKLSTFRGQGGTGLGLVICHQLLHLMGGTLKVESQVKFGTTFTILLPVVEAKAELLDYEDSTRCSLITKADAMKRSILLVDDNEIIRKLLSRIISDMGFNIVTAANGAEALDKLFSNPHFDLILMDLTMPVMDGYTSARRMRYHHDYKGPIIALTAKTEIEDASEVRECGMTDIFWKPISRKELAALFVKYIGMNDTRFPKNGSTCGL
jgi:CheY-like chemotaxis protein